jgi:hypothetical protein
MASGADDELLTVEGRACLRPCLLGYWGELTEAHRLLSERLCRVPPLLVDLNDWNATLIRLGSTGRELLRSAQPVLHHDPVKDGLQRPQSSAIKRVSMTEGMGCPC